MQEQNRRLVQRGNLPLLYHRFAQNTSLCRFFSGDIAPYVRIWYTERTNHVVEAIGMKQTGYILKNDAYSLRVLFYSPAAARVTIVRSADEAVFEKDESLIVTAERPQQRYGWLTGERTAMEISTGRMKLAVDRKTLAVRCLNEEGKTLSEIRPGAFEAYDIYRMKGGEAQERSTVDGMRVTLEGGEQEFVRSAYHAGVKVAFSDTEAVYGLGSQEEGYQSLRGQFVPLYQENMRIALPYFVSNAGYAYLFDCTSLMTFDWREGNEAEIYLDCVNALDFYILTGGYDDVCRQYRALTGETPMLPLWAVGYAQSKERYRTADELIEIVKEYRRRGVPMDLIVQDWLTWVGELWGDKNLDPERFPDPQALTDELHRLGARMMISIWPNMTGDGENKREFLNAGLMLGDGSVYNAFSPEGRDMYWKQAYNGIFRFGTDAWWCDSSEPYDKGWGGVERAPLLERMAASVGEFKKYVDDGLINAYSIEHSRGIYEHQRATSEEKRVTNLTRSGMSGQHRYGAIVWSGDVSANWATLARQVNILQNYVACGEAYWNSDIGAFFAKGGREWFRQGEYENGCEDLGYRELYTRWLQFAAFTPFMRSHGTNTPREIWRFGEKGGMFYDAIEKFIRLRYMLTPYFYSLNARVTFEGLMPVTPLAMAWTEDMQAAEAEYEYLYGKELLVCPVTEPMYYETDSRELEGVSKTRSVYLPEGTWYDFLTGEKVSGGRRIEAECPIDRIPLYVRAGAVIPTMEVMQYTGENPLAPVDVRIYRGADGRFTLYSDAGDGYGYEQGEYWTADIAWNDEAGEYSIRQTGDERFAREIRVEIIG